MSAERQTRYRLLYSLRRDRYFVKWTAIGPMLGSKREAQIFETKEAALLVPRHALCPLELDPVEETE